MAIKDRNIIIAAIAVISLSVAGLLAPAADPTKDSKQLRDRVGLFMRSKLANSQSVLEGITTEDFDLIRKGAERMIVMSKAAEWKAAEGEAYSQDTAQFVRVARDLVRDAKEKNLDAAAVDYLQMTMNCVSCHKHVRQEKFTGDVIPMKKAHSPNPSSGTSSP